MRSWTCRTVVSTRSLATPPWWTEWLKSNPKLAAVGDKVTDKAYFGTGLGIAVRQGNTDLQQKFNAALEKVKKDGTYQTIYNKWFQK